MFNKYIFLSSEHVCILYYYVCTFKCTKIFFCQNILMSNFWYFHLRSFQRQTAQVLVLSLSTTYPMMTIPRNHLIQHNKYDQSTWQTSNSGWQHICSGISDVITAWQNVPQRLAYWRTLINGAWAG